MFRVRGRRNGTIGGFGWKRLLFMLQKRQICWGDGFSRTLLWLSTNRYCGERYLVQQSMSRSLYVSLYVRVFLLGEWICFQVDVNGWLEAFAAHPPIGENPSMTHESPTSTQFSFLPLSFSLIFHFIFSVIPRVGKVRRDVLISTLPS